MARSLSISYQIPRELTGRSRTGRRSIHESPHPESTVVDHCAAGRLLECLVEQLSAEGDLSAEWRETFLAVPRHLFIPDTVWHQDPAIEGPNDLVPVHRRASCGGEMPVHPQPPSGASPSPQTPSKSS